MNSKMATVAANLWPVCCSATVYSLGWTWAKDWLCSFMNGLLPLGHNLSCVKVTVQLIWTLTSQFIVFFSVGLCCPKTTHRISIAGFKLLTVTISGSELESVMTDWSRDLFYLFRFPVLHPNSPSLSQEYWISVPTTTSGCPVIQRWCRLGSTLSRPTVLDWALSDSSVAHKYGEWPVHCPISRLTHR